MNTPAPQSLESEQSLMMVIYALYAASFVVGITAIGIVVGAPMLFASGIWVIYRIVKGWLRLSENKPMYQVP
jgi:uncharacterized membrane protein